MTFWHQESRFPHCFQIRLLPFNMAMGCLESQHRKIASQLFWLRSCAMLVPVWREVSILINHCNVLFGGMALNHLYCILLVWRLPLFWISCSVVLGLQTCNRSLSKLILWSGVSSSFVLAVDVSSMTFFRVPSWSIISPGFPQVIHLDCWTLKAIPDMVGYGVFITHI